MLATEGTGRYAHRPPARPHALPGRAWFLDSSVPLPPHKSRPTHRFRGSGLWTGRGPGVYRGASARRLPRHHHAVPSRRVVALAPIDLSITATTASFISQRPRPANEQRTNPRLHAATCDHPLPLPLPLLLVSIVGVVDDDRAHGERPNGHWVHRGGSSHRERDRDRRRSRHAAGELGAAGGRGGLAVGARDEPVADDGRGVVGEGSGDRAAAGGDAGDAARPPRVRVRALAHRPRRESRGRGRRGRRRRSRSCACASALAEDGGEGSVGVRRAAAGAGAGGGEARAEGVGAATGQREHRRGQLPQQQRRRPAQLLHAAVAHPELHRAAPHPDAVHLRLPEPQRRIRLQQEGEGPGRRDRQVLVVAVGSAVAQVQPAGPGRAAQRERVLHPRRVGRHPKSGQALRSAGQCLSRFFSSAAGCVAGFQLQLCAVRLSVHRLSCDL